MRNSARLERLRLGRLPWIGALVALVFLSGLDLHPAGQVHEVLGGMDVAAGPAHPGHDRSICPSFPEQGDHPLCPACLHHLLTRGAHLAAVVTPVPPVRQDLLHAAIAVRTASGSEHPSGARAPPLA
ncbi:MAG TPA: hypothetical protein VGE98_01115 [Thermoanaerobaculia bacterium]